MYIVVALYFHMKRLKQDHHKRLYFIVLRRATQRIGGIERPLCVPNRNKIKELPKGGYNC
jgi:hypothetical protein